MNHRLTVRDVEILRTLARVQLATTGALQGTFFTQVKLARRRLNTLRQRGYIAPHDRGLRAALAGAGGRYWRLTTVGVQALAEALPHEPLPDNLVSRAAGASLRNFEHRNAIADLYLSLIADRDKDPAEIRRRAGAIGWAGEYDVALGYEDFDGGDLVQRRVIPDATVTTPATRLFVEVDRSTESRARCARALRGYARHIDQGRYGARFGDDRAPYVLYVTRSEARRAGLAQVVEGLELPMPVVVLSFVPAVRWLAQAAFGGEGGADVDSAEVLAARHPSDSDTVRLLRAVYEVAREGVQRRLELGDLDGADAVPECLSQAYALLVRRGAVDA